MTREAKEDLAALQAFVRTYNLSTVSAAPEYEGLLSQQHRRYLPLLILLAELADLRAMNGLPAISPLPSMQQMEYLQESGSDVGQALFCWMHGAQKGARVLLRSGIETFVKGVACAEQPLVLTETRLFKMFELASSTTFFRAKVGAQLFRELNTFYGELSAYVHTASSSHMNHVSALNYFPSFNAVDAKTSADAFSAVCSRIVVALSLLFNTAFHAMHHRNKETILDAIPNAYKPHIQNIA